MYCYHTFRYMLAATLSIAIPLSGNQTALAIEILPPITITAPAKPLSALINNPQQLDEEDIVVAHERSISDVLYGLPGLTINKIGGYGQLSGLLVRGIGGQGLMTLDGIPLLVSLPGLQNLDTLPTEAIETAEIERGPSAAHYSFQALGGAIRLYTRNKEDTGGKLSVEGGSFGILRETCKAAFPVHLAK